MNQNLNALRNRDFAACSQLLVTGLSEDGGFCWEVYDMASLRKNPPRLASIDGIEYFNNLRFIQLVGFDVFEFDADDLNVLRRESERAERLWWIQNGDGRDISRPNYVVVSHRSCRYRDRRAA